MNFESQIYQEIIPCNVAMWRCWYHDGDGRKKVEDADDDDDEDRGDDDEDDHDVDDDGDNDADDDGDDEAGRWRRREDTCC